MRFYAWLKCPNYLNIKHLCKYAVFDTPKYPLIRYAAMTYETKKVELAKMSKSLREK